MKDVKMPINNTAIAFAPLTTYEEPMTSDKFRVSIHRHFYRIAVEQRRIYSQLDAAMSQTESVGVPDDEIISALEKRSAQYEKREQAAVIGITFAAMCLEAFFTISPPPTLAIASQKNMSTNWTYLLNC
jgi:hypothetical protein